jgi:hypothetical protein
MKGVPLGEASEKAKALRKANTVESPEAPQAIRDTSQLGKRRPKMPLSAAPARGGTKMRRTRISIKPLPA